MNLTEYKVSKAMVCAKTRAAFPLAVSLNMAWYPVQSIHLANLARAHAAVVGVSEATALGQFSGVFWGVFAVNQVFLAELSDRTLIFRHIVWHRVSAFRLSESLDILKKMGFIMKEDRE